MGDLPAVDQQVLSSRVDRPMAPVPLDYQRLSFLYQTVLAFNSRLDPDEILAQLLEGVLELLQASIANAWLIDEQSHDIVCRHSVGLSAERFIGYRVPPGTSLMGWAVEHAQTVYTPDLRTDPRYIDTISRYAKVDTRSLICAPLKLPPGGGRVIGVIAAAHTKPEAFSPADVTLLNALAAAAATAVENARLYERAQMELRERAKMERALRQSEAHYRTLIETSPSAILSMDLEGQIVMINRQGLELWDYNNQSELLGKNFLSLVAPKDRPATYRQLRQVLSGCAIRNQEITLLRSDGSCFDGEYAASLMADEQGQPMGVVAFVRDITARKEAEAVIHRSNENLRILNDLATHISQVTDQRSILQTALDKTLAAFHVDTGWAMLTKAGTSLGAPPETLLIQRGILLRPDAAEIAQRLRQHVLTHISNAQGPILVNATEVGLPLHGPTATYLVAAVPLTSHSDIIGVLAIVGVREALSHTTNTPDMRLLAAIGHQVNIALENAYLSATAAEIEMLRELDKQRSELIARFSHNLKTPLGIIKFSSTTLLREDVDFSVATQRELLRDIDTQVDRLSRMVDRVLEAGRTEKELSKQPHEPTDIIALIQEVTESIQHTLTQHRLTLDFDRAALIADIDAEAITEVLVNLLDNAVKYSPDGGNIVIKGQLQGGWIHISITDEGIGIPKADLPHIFERFYRATNAKGIQARGVGLGLAICRQIIEAHSGMIWVESDPGSGTTVTFTLLPSSHTYSASPDETLTTVASKRYQEKL